MTQPESAIVPDLPPLPVVFQSDPTRVLGYACPLCSIFYSNATFGGAPEAGAQAAIQCCQRSCLACAARLEKGWGYTYCKVCLAARSEEKAMKRIEAATKIAEADYTGPVFCEANEEYYATTDDLRDGFDGDDLPSEIWACTTETLKLSADHILDNAFEDHHEGARDGLASEAESHLQTMLDAWIAAFAHDVVSWTPDYKRLVVLTAEEPDEVTQPKHPAG